MPENDPKTETLRLVKQHLEMIDKHTDNYTNGSFAAHTDAGQLKVAGLVIDITRTQVREALNDLNRVLEA